MGVWYVLGNLLAISETSHLIPYKSPVKEMFTIFIPISKRQRKLLKITEIVSSMASVQSWVPTAKVLFLHTVASQPTP